MSREAIFLDLHKKKLHLLNLTPGDLRQKEISHLTNPAFHLCRPLNLKTKRWPQRVQIFVFVFFFCFRSSVTFPHGPAAAKPFDLGPLMLFGRHVSIFWYSFRTTQEGHTSHVCRLRRESLKQDRPPAQILDQTARPFKVTPKEKKKNDGLQSALQIYISHKSHATLTRCLGYSLLKGHAHSLQTEEAKRLLRRRQGWERYFQSLWRSILHCNTSHRCALITGIGHNLCQSLLQWAFKCNWCGLFWTFESITLDFLFLFSQSTLSNFTNNPLFPTL